MEKETVAPGAGASVLSALGLSVLGTTCCALPIALVALGAGGAVASLASAAPWLVTLSEYKAATFSATGLVLGYAWWRVRGVSQCDISDAKRLRVQRRVLWAASAIFAVSMFAAYAALPLLVWLDS